MRAAAPYYYLLLRSNCFRSSSGLPGTTHAALLRRCMMMVYNNNGRSCRRYYYYYYYVRSSQRAGATSDAAVRTHARTPHQVVGVHALDEAAHLADPVLHRVVAAPGAARLVRQIPSHDCGAAAAAAGGAARPLFIAARNVIKPRRWLLAIARERRRGGALPGALTAARA